MNDVDKIIASSCCHFCHFHYGHLRSDYKSKIYDNTSGHKTSPLGKF